MGQQDLMVDGQIRPDKLEDLLVEVCSGKTIFTSAGELYASRSPSMAEQDTARIVYARKLHEVKRLGLPTRDQVEEKALALGILDPKERSEAKGLEGVMERQIKAREIATEAQQKVSLAGQIETLRRRLIELRGSEEMVFLHTAEVKAEEARTKYLVACCTRTGELLDKPLWPTWDSFQEYLNADLVHDARQAYLRASTGLAITIIRGLARNHEWRTRWRASKETGTPIFPGASSDWDANKRNLVWWTDFYDAVMKHPECPSEDVLRDDEALQEWINGLSSKGKAPASASAPKQPRTFLDGNGRRIPSVTVGQERIAVNQPYKVRV